MSDMKFCVDCKHYINQFETNGNTLHRCNKYRTIDLVTGKFIALGWCDDVRSRSSLRYCGEDAIGFEPKEMSE